MTLPNLVLVLLMTPNTQSFMSPSLFGGIVPKSRSLLLKQNLNDNSASVLELYIDIVEEKFRTGIFDKRKEFPFDVCRYPSTNSNIPDSTLYNVFYSQLIRIYRVCNFLTLFETAIQELFSRCVTKGATKKLLRNQISKFFQRNSPIKFQIPCNDFLANIL